MRVRYLYIKDMGEMGGVKDSLGRTTRKRIYNHIIGETFSHLF